MRSVLSVSLPPELARELTAFARREGRNKSDIVKESLGRFLWEARLARAREVLAPKARRKGIITDEDLFRALS